MMESGSKFKENYSKGRKLLAAYWVLGYPDLPTSLKIMECIAEEGVDIVEIGFPYSDPVADGKAIQNAAKIALEEKMQIKDLWEAVKLVKVHSSPFLMTYGNIPLQYGVERFQKEAIINGLEGIILPDIPPSHYPEQLTRLNPAFIISPNTSERRIEILAKASHSFMYFISGLATTGGEQRFDPRVSNQLQLARTFQKNAPALVGFGISDQMGVIEALKMGFDGIIIGSALLKAYESNEIQGVIKVLRGIRRRMEDFLETSAIF